MNITTIDSWVIEGSEWVIERRDEKEIEGINEHTFNK